AHDLLLSSDARALGYFRREAVARLLDENQQGQADHGKRIWTLLNLELWLRQYMG
ncbi:MAG: hypothetical protein GY796_24165, partial [Chloroflexi bacterium]|nr:hypothetical protein [Chloroflexota bacterium]